MVTSTSETYGTAQYVPIDENHPKVGQSPYSASKIGADQIALSYFLSFGLPVKIVRPFNTYGPRQSARAIIPTVITQTLDNSVKELKLGNLHPTRDLTFVKDTAKGFIAIAQSEKCIGESTNIGMSNEISMKDLVNKIFELTGISKPIITDDIRVRKDTSEVERLFCANDKIKRLTNWSPDYNIDKGLKETIDFIKNNLRLYKPNLYNI
jgi:nucleoside-diphosphate-sugar epimerase